MLCSRCKKRTAVVFISSSNGRERKEEGLCLVCARKANMPQIKEYMDQMGLTDENLEEFSNAMTDFGNIMNPDELQADVIDGEDSEFSGEQGSNGGFFKPGGIGSLPRFFHDIFCDMAPNASPNGNNAENDSVKQKNERSDEDSRKAKKANKRKFLSTFCTDLTKRARENKLDNIVGRDKEIERTMQILCRRQKNNPCLIGEPGVGKTAIAEGLALKIASGDAPFQLSDKEIYLVDLTAIVAGTQFRGQFESRLKGLIDEVEALGNIILFIDEIHNIVGAGDSESGSMNAANILKPALSRGEIQVIGATTFKEYRKHIEKDSALERRFQPVTVNEPTVSDAYNILLGIKGYYEQYHRVKISDEMLMQCAVFSERYVHDRYLPDKSIDLLDEACANRSLRCKEFGKLHEAKKSETEIEEKISALESSNEPDYEQIATLKSESLRITTDIAALEKQVENICVEDSDLAHVIELWTGIPANKIEESEFKRLRGLEESMKKRIIGQDTAVEDVCKAIRRTRVRLSDRRRPASFIFVGPTGVGKTELVKVINDEMFSGTDTLIRLDMTEYMEKHTVSRMIGSPPGYVGYDDAGQLTEKVRRHPYSVILFDEIEKAHPDVMNLLLQILDEGKVNDAQGRSVNFENTIICMTSNAGSTDKSTGLGFNRTEVEISKDRALKALSEFLRPEFLGRVDEIVVFNPLTKENYAEIAGLMLSKMKEPLAEKGITLKYSKKALELIAEKAYGRKFGGRDIRNVIRTEVEDKIAALIIDAGAKGIQTVKISVKKDELDISAEPVISKVSLEK